MTALPFHLRVPDQAEINGPEITTISHRLWGVARIEGAAVVLEWGGTREVARVKPGALRSTPEAVPTGEVRLAVTGVVAAALRGGWWRPRLEIRLRELRQVLPFPGMVPGVLLLWLARRDRRAAREFLVTLEVEQADAALRAAESDPLLPGS